MAPARLRLLRSLYYTDEYKHIRRHDFFTDRILIYSPLYLHDIHKGVSMLYEAITQKKHIFIFGDKDVDGVTSTAMLYDYLKTRFPDSAISYGNSRDGDTYGISPRILNMIGDIHPDVIIFLDMGSSHLSLVKELVDKQKQVLIIDHHIPQIKEEDNQVLSQIAFINPLLSEIRFENENKISTSGVVLKFILYFEFYVNSANRKVAVIHHKNDYYIYQNGYFLGKNAYLDEEKDFFGEPLKKYQIFSIHDISYYFQETGSSELEKILLDNPREFGKYITCLAIELREEILQTFMKYAMLAAIGMVADQVPLIGENRTIVKAGIHLLRYKPVIMTGLQALMQSLGLNIESLTSRDINWSVVPVLNAAGRIGETEKALEVLLEKDPQLAMEKSKILIELNNQRKERTKINTEILDNNRHHIQEESGFVLFYHDDLQPGVSGLMAARLADRYQKPAIWINPEGEYAKGSVRTWNGVNVLEMLLPLKDLFVDIGGHAEAAGFTITYENITILKEKLKSLTQNYHAGLNAALRKETKNYYELGLKPGMLGKELLEEIKLLEPFGNGNPELYIVLKNVKICNYEFFHDKHLRFKVVNALDDIDFIYWNAVVQSNLPAEKLDNFRWDIVGSLERNVYYPFYTGSSLRFYVKQIKIAGPSQDEIDVIFNTER